MAETTEPRTFVTIYEDERGRFISDSEYPTWQEAYESRDQLSSYRETVEIVRYNQ